MHLSHDTTVYFNIYRVQQPEPEVRHSKMTRTSWPSQSQDHVPDVVCSPSSPKSTPPKEYVFETVMASSPPLRKGINSDVWIVFFFFFFL